MNSIKLKIQERAFPSRGRARINESHLKELGVKGGDEVDLFRDEHAKPVVVTVFADTLVEHGYIRISTEDIATIGIPPGKFIVVKKRSPLAERAKKSAKESAESVKAGAKGAVESIKGKTQKAEKELKIGASTAKETIDKSTDKVMKNINEKDL